MKKIILLLIPFLFTSCTLEECPECEICLIEEPVIECNDTFDFIEIMFELDSSLNPFDSNLSSQEINLLRYAYGTKIGPQISYLKSYGTFGDNWTEWALENYGISTQIGYIVLQLPKNNTLTSNFYPQELTYIFNKQDGKLLMIYVENAPTISERTHFVVKRFYDGIDYSSKFNDTFYVKHFDCEKDVLEALKTFLQNLL